MTIPDDFRLAIGMGHRGLGQKSAGFFEQNHAHMRDTGLLQSLYPVDPPIARTWNM
jgi:hypothetical protein